MAHRRRLDARAHALPENSPIWEEWCGGVLSSEDLGWN